MIIKNIEDIRKYLMKKGVAYENEIFGCNDAEINYLERTYGTLPNSYKQILQFMGIFAGTFIFYDELTFYYDEICECNESWQDVDSPLPSDSFVMFERYGEDTHFITTNSGQDDSAVFYLSEHDYSIKKAYNSVWDIMEGLLQDSRKILRDDYSYLDYTKDLFRCREKSSNDGIRSELPDYYKNKIQRYRYR